VKKRLLFYIFILCFFSSYGQDTYHTFEQFTIDDGLSQSEVKCIQQDSKGFLWFGTLYGLNRYNGLSFEVFVTNPTDSNSISNNIIYTLWLDHQNKLWIGTQDGLNIYDPRLDKISIIKKNSQNTNSLGDNKITAIIQDDELNYWIGTDGGGLTKVIVDENGDFHYNLYQNVLSNPLSISSNNITSILQDSYGFMWVGTSDGGINKMDPSTGRFLRYKEGPNSINSNVVSCIYEDTSKTLWVGTKNGLTRFSPVDGKRLFERSDNIKTYLQQDEKNSISSNDIQCIVQDSTGHLWIGTNSGGLNKYQLANGKFEQIEVISDSPTGLLSNSIKSIFIDHKGSLWIGTNAGINKLDINHKQIKLYQRENRTANTLSSNNITALYKERNGTIWVGTYDGGLNRVNDRTRNIITYTSKDIIVAGKSLNEKYQEEYEEKMKKYRSWRYRRLRAKLKVNKADTLSSDRILSLHRDKNKKLWIGTDGGGLNILDLKTGNIDAIRANFAYSDSLSSDVINYIYEDSDGVFWFGTSKGGLNRYSNNKFKRYMFDINNPFSLSHNEVRAITEDSEDNLWVATYGGGLNKLDKDQNFTRYQKHENDSNSISSNVVFSIFADSCKLWIGTAEGLDLLDLSTYRFKKYSRKDGLASNLVYGILKDDNGNLWLSTNKGIAKFNIAQETFYNFDEKYGLQSNEFNSGAYQKSLTGEMLFGGINGFNSFYPEELKPNAEVPKVILTNFNINNKPVTIGPTGRIPVHISELKDIQLTHKENVLSFEFIAIDFVNPKNIKYYYKLENFDEDWIPSDGRRFVTYTNLEPNDYVFKVKATKSDGSAIGDEEVTSLNIEIEPPYYGTWWFKILVVLGLIGIGYLVYYIRIYNMANTNRRLTRLVDEKTYEIVFQKEHIEKQNEELEEQKEEIASQRDLVYTQKSKIEEKNQQLEKAKKEVLRANQKLKKINEDLEGKINKRTEKLKNTLNQLLQTNKELDTFIYRASHDLKGPITRLLGLTMLAKLDNMKNNTQDFIKVIETNSHDMNRMLNKLINVHEIDKETISYSEIEPEKLLNESRNALDIILKDSPIILNLKSKFNKKKKITSDEKLLKLAIVNLLENAVIFRQENEVNISIELFEENKALHIIVEDDGLGIEEQYFERIFAMFFRGSEKSKGNGLGLYIVKKIMFKLGGEVSVASEENKFTRFEIKLPLKEINKILEEQEG
jgi:ligand-binding sensor domain-containing protein/signal transduction histidine kinase